MAQFAHYYIKYKHDFAPYDWEKRQQHLGALFEKERISEGHYVELLNLLK